MDYMYPLTRQRTVKIKDIYDLETACVKVSIEENNIEWDFTLSELKNIVRYVEDEIKLAGRIFSTKSTELNWREILTKPQKEKK